MPRLLLGHIRSAGKDFDVALRRIRKVNRVALVPREPIHAQRRLPAEEMIEGAALPGEHDHVLDPRVHSSDGRAGQGGQHLFAWLGTPIRDAVGGSTAAVSGMILRSNHPRAGRASTHGR